MTLWFQNIRLWIQRLPPRIEYRVCLLMLVLRDRRVSWTARMVALSGVAYFFSTFDLIPDTIPVVGYLDDAVAISVSLYLTRLMVPSYIYAEHTAYVDALSHNGTQYFSIIAALRGSEAHANLSSMKAVSSPSRYEYNFLLP